METGSVGGRKRSAGMIADSLWLWDEDEEGQFKVSASMQLVH